MGCIRSVHNKLIGSLRPSTFVGPGVAHSNARAQQRRALHLRVTATAEEDIPQPQEPGPEDCCQSGCLECVWEQYRLQMQQYQAQEARKRGEAFVPAEDPFEAMERQLAEQQQQRQQHQQEQQGSS